MLKSALVQRHERFSLVERIEKSIVVQVLGNKFRNLVIFSPQVTIYERITTRAVGNVDAKVSTLRSHLLYPIDRRIATRHKAN